MSAGATLVTEREGLDSLLASLTQTPGSSAPTQPQWLKALRAQALERVNALTLPSTHDEAWRFTPLAAFASQSFQPLRTPPPPAAARRQASVYRRGADAAGVCRRRACAATLQPQPG